MSNTHVVKLGTGHLLGPYTEAGAKRVNGRRLLQGQGAEVVAIANLRLQVWQEGWTAANSRGQWVDAGREPTTAEIQAAGAGPEGQFFVENGKPHNRPFGSASAIMMRVIEREGA